VKFCTGTLRTKLELVHFGSGIETRACFSGKQKKTVILQSRVGNDHLCVTRGKTTHAHTHTDTYIHTCMHAYMHTCIHHTGANSRQEQLGHGQRSKVIRTLRSVFGNRFHHWIEVGMVCMYMCVCICIHVCFCMEQV
jgi:hypothetical protein